MMYGREAIDVSVMNFRILQYLLEISYYKAFS